MITTKGRYALRVMTDLAENGGTDFTPLREIAERQEISEKYLEGILRLLVGHGLLEARKGPAGGYRLTRTPGEYSVIDILEATEKDLAPVACLAGDAEACPRAATCRTLPMWKALDGLTREFFGAITISDLATGRLRNTTLGERGTVG